MFAIEIFEINEDLTPTIFSELFTKRNIQYKLRHDSRFSVPNLRSTFYAIESFSYLVPKIWDIVPEEGTSDFCMLHGF